MFLTSHLHEPFILKYAQFKKKQLINSRFSFRNICLETALGFIRGPHSCNFYLSSAEDILQDGRLKTLKTTIIIF